MRYECNYEVKIPCIGYLTCVIYFRNMVIEHILFAFFKKKRFLNKTQFTVMIIISHKL